MSEQKRVRHLLTAGVTSYLIGSFPTGDMVSRFVARRNNHGPPVDLRVAGTGNPGALNAAKILGTKWGLLVLAGDVLKGCLASIAGRRIADDDGAYVAGIGAVAGHCFPPWKGFRGGKGVATSAGTSIICFPAYMPFDLGLAGATVMLSKGQAGIATYLSSACFTGAAAYWCARRKGNLWGPRATRWLPAYAASTSALIAYKFLSAPAMSSAALAPEHLVADADDTMGCAVAS